MQLEVTAFGETCSIHAVSSAVLVGCHLHILTQAVGGILDVEYRPLLFGSHTVVLEHSVTGQFWIWSSSFFKGRTSRLCAHLRPRRAARPWG